MCGVKLLPRWHVCSRVRKWLLSVTTHVVTDNPVASLTFDDGPHPEFTPRLLQILKRHGASATFFMIGEKAHRHPDIVRCVAEAGHAIGNHSWNHVSFPSLDGARRREQIRACANVIKPCGDRLFRPPYGHLNARSRLDIVLLGHKVVGWNIDARDWDRRDGGLIAQNLLARTQAGSIILLHDGTADEANTDRAATLEAVQLFLQGIGNRLRFVTVPQLFQQGVPQRQEWYQLQTGS
jgi:peptidoglycan/xylan/chitin deacetylase (PgdA/CDA1 family)